MTFPIEDYYRRISAANAAAAANIKATNITLARLSENLTQLELRLAQREQISQDHVEQGLEDHADAIAQLIAVANRQQQRIESLLNR